MGAIEIGKVLQVLRRPAARFMRRRASSERQSCRQAEVAALSEVFCAGWVKWHLRVCESFEPDSELRHLKAVKKGRQPL